MTGKIKNLNSRQRSGFIETADHKNFRFDWSTVLAYDVAHLAEGHSVTFDAQWPDQAVNVCLQGNCRAPSTESKRAESTFRYLGFEQTDGIRTHRFERTTLGQRSEPCAVHTDTRLFAKLRIGIQEGPTLCLRLLDKTVGELASERALTEQDMLAYLASKPVPARRSPPRRLGRTAS